MTDHADLVDGNPIRVHPTALGDITQVETVDASGNYVAGGGGGGGIQYPDATTQATPTGNVILWKDASNVLHVPSIANPLPVTGGGGGSLAALANDATHAPTYANGGVATLQTDLAGNLKVNQGNTSYTVDSIAAHLETTQLMPVQTAISANTSTNVVFPGGLVTRGFSVENRNGWDINYALDTAATAGTHLLPTGCVALVSDSCTAVTLLSPYATTVNGTAAGGIVISGAS